MLFKHTHTHTHTHTYEFQNYDPLWGEKEGNVMGSGKGSEKISILLVIFYFLSYVIGFLYTLPIYFYV